MLSLKKKCARYHIVLQSTGKFRAFFIVGNRPLGSFAGITAAIPAPVSEKKYYSAVYVCVWVSLCARLQQNSSVSLEFKFMDFKF